MDGVNFYTWPSTAQVIADVQSWLDSPQAPPGWILIAENESLPRTSKWFDTRENVDPAFRPVLQVQFTPPEDAGFNDGGLADGAGLIGKSDFDPELLGRDVQGGSAGEEIFFRMRRCSRFRRF